MKSTHATTQIRPRSVSLYKSKTVSDGSSCRLHTLKLREETVIAFVPEHLPLSRRLLDLGFIPGTRVQCTLVGPGAEIAAYRLRGTTIALRKEDASQIEVCDHRPGGQS